MPILSSALVLSASSASGKRRSRYGEVSIYAGNESGKAGELSKLTAVFPPVDKFLTVRKRKKQQKKVSIQHIVDDWIFTFFKGEKIWL